MPTVTQGNTGSFTVNIGERYRVTTSGEAYVDLVGETRSYRLTGGASEKFVGPFQVQRVVTVRAISGDCTYALHTESSGGGDSSVNIGSLDTPSETEALSTQEASEAFAALQSDTSSLITTNVAISGTARVGQTLTATPATFTSSGSSISYAWYRGGNVISGATAITYVLVDADLGYDITVKQSATVSGQSVVSTSNAISMNSLDAVPNLITSLNAGNASTTTADYGALTSWADEFGGSVTATQTAKSTASLDVSMAPSLDGYVGGFKAVNFAAEKVMNLALPLASGINIFMDVVPYSVANRNIMTSVTGGLQLKINSDATVSILRDGSAELLKSTGNSIAKGNRYVLGFISRSNFNQILFNGSSVAQNTTDPAYTQATTQILGSDGIGSNFRGAMRRLVAYSGTLTEAQIAFINTYITTYAGVTGEVSTASDKTINALEMGVKADGILLKDGKITSGQNTLSSETYAFTSVDVGKLVAIRGAGQTRTVNGVTVTEALTGYIGSVSNGVASIVTTSGGSTARNASATVSTAITTFGSDDTTALNLCAIACSNLKSTVELPSGIMVISDSINLLSNVRFVGKGDRATTLKYIRATEMNGSVFLGTQDDPNWTYMDCYFAHFGIDTDDVWLDGYSVSKKHFYVKGAVRFTIEHLLSSGSPATAFGIDKIVQMRIINNRIFNSGRYNLASSGGAGIGIGTTDSLYTDQRTGVQHVESYLISNNYVYNPTRYGIFMENQNTNRSPANCIISNNIIEMTDKSVVGIADCGQEGIIIANNTVTGTAVGDGIKVARGSLPISKPGLKGHIVNNTIRGTLNPILIDYSGDSVTSALTANYTIANNKIVGAADDGIKVLTSSTVGYVISGLYIRDNEISDSQNAGISFSGTAPINSLLVDGNVCVNNGKEGAGIQSGIYFGMDCEGVTIRDNMLYDDQGTATQDYGLELAAGVDLTKTMVTGNYFDGNATDAVGLNTTGTITGVQANNLGYTP